MILQNETTGLFTLHTRNTTYQMKVGDYRVLLHLYYGPRLEGDLSYLVRYADRSHSPNPNEAGDNRMFSLDVMPQEYSTCGVGDYRLPSLELELPNGSHTANLRYTGCEIRSGKYELEGLPAFYAPEDKAETLVIFLEDAAAHVGVELYYGVLEEYDLITRAVRVVNRGTEPVYLQQAASLCLELQRPDLDFITFDGHHARERIPSRSPVRPGVQSINSNRGMSSHQHNPFVVLCEQDANEDHGVCYGAMLLYSGNFEASVERNQLEDSRLVMGIHPYHFRWKLEPGAVFTTPEAALICSPCGFGQMSQQLHRAIRTNLRRDPYGRTRKPVLVNNWEATYFDFTADQLVEIAREAAGLGIELFVMDDGWFGNRNDDFRGLGDWYVNEKKLPGGLGALIDRIKGLGMKFGIWVEPEMVNEDSDLYRTHPDWILNVPGRVFSRGRGQLVLDFSRQDVRDHIYHALTEILAHDVSYVKWDMNRCLTEVWSALLPSDRQGEVYHRYVLGVYDLLERIHQDYPQLLIEGCCGGGGRFDAGMLYYTPQIWCSDNTDAVDRLGIQYGTSFCYPICAIGAHVSAVPNEQNGRMTPMETRGVVAMSGTFGYELDLRRLSQAEKEIVSRQVAEFKAHADLIQWGDYYRLTSPFDNTPYTAWEQVSEDRREALVSIVTGSTRATPPFFILRLKGLDPNLTYRIDGGETLYTGAMLMTGGYPLPVSLMMGDYQSLQLYLKAE